MQDKHKVDLPLAWPARRDRDQPRIGVLIVIASALVLAGVVIYFLYG